MVPMEYAVFNSSQIRQIEDLAIHEHHISEQDLMLRAGQAAFNVLRTSYPHVSHIAVFCGGGNNGGDGYVLAHLAKKAGLGVVIYHDKSEKTLPLAAQNAYEQAIKQKIPTFHFDDALDSDVELIVDALLGIGLSGQVRDPLHSVLEFINEQDLPVLSIDIPSGLCADTGNTLGCCVRADTTITFIGQKLGLYTLNGPDHCGEIFCDDLQLKTVIKSITPALSKLHQNQFQSLIQPRKKNTHKGMFGHVLIIGGGPGMPGAPCLSAMAAMGVGAGLVTVATHPMHVNGCIPGLPEAMIVGVDSEASIPPLLEQTTVCIVGPGLGEDPWAQSIFKRVISSQLPLIIDASALNLLAKENQHDDHWILTPHSGEAAKLLHTQTKDIQSDRLKSAHKIQQQYGGCVILKGVGSLISSGTAGDYICTAGNPGMSTAGMGDILSGVLGGLVAQGMILSDAAQLGVWLHAKASDDAVTKMGEKGLLASEIIPFIRKRLNTLG